MGVGITSVGWMGFSYESGSPRCREIVICRSFARWVDGVRGGCFGPEASGYRSGAAGLCGSAQVSRPGVTDPPRCDTGGADV